MLLAAGKNHCFILHKRLTEAILASCQLPIASRQPQLALTNFGTKIALVFGKDFILLVQLYTMKKEILIIKNSTTEGPGLLEELLIERSIAYQMVDLDHGEPFPQVNDYGAVVVLGGPDSANDQNEKMALEQARIRQVLDAKIPYLGICLGLQTLVKAAGGKVVKSPLKEVGFKGPDGMFFTIELTEQGKADLLFKGLESTLKVFHLHGETVELNEDMILLGKGKFCPSQVVKIGSNAYGLQCHFELTPDMFESWITEDVDLLELNTQRLREDFDSLSSQYRDTGRQLFANFLNIAGF